MATIPTCVGVIIYNSSGQLGACTISSFVSLSVEPGNETVMFTLKQGSGTGQTLMTTGRFSVSILHSGQPDIALLGGTSLSREEIHSKLSDKISWSSEGTPFLLESHLYFDLELHERIETVASNIFVCKVFSAQSNFCLATEPMIYLRRKFTKAQSSE
jgi:flavin reductase (DIM6/NTAB) family NADH-FMN oxidoreductase RutF